jgi:hypothetical protein
MLIAQFIWGKELPAAGAQNHLDCLRRPHRFRLRDDGGEWGLVRGLPADLAFLLVIWGIGGSQRAWPSPADGIGARRRSSSESAIDGDELAPVVSIPLPLVIGSSAQMTVLLCLAIS